MMSHTVNIHQQITHAWQEYVTAQLDHQPDTADDIMRRINALLDCIPRKP